MAQALFPEDRWSLVAAHRSNHCRSAKGGLLRVDDRAALTGIVFFLTTGMPSDICRVSSAAAAA